MANCMILGSSALRILPNWAELRFVLMAPGRKLFSTLYASARNSRLWVSRKRNTRDRATSNCQAVGSFKRGAAQISKSAQSRLRECRRVQLLGIGAPDLSRYTFG